MFIKIGLSFTITDFHDRPSHFSKEFYGFTFMYPIKVRVNN